MKPPEKLYIEKILELIYSGPGPNDALVLEMLKNGSYNQRFLGPLITIALTTQRDQLAAEVIEFITPRTPDQQIRKIKESVKRKNYKVYEHYLQTDFERPLVVDILYTDFRRSGNSYFEFLKADDGTHPDRKTIFQTFLESFSNRKGYVTIPILTPDELAVYLEKILKNHPARPFQDLIIHSPATTQLPDHFFTRIFKRVVINAGWANAPFPDFIFKFQGVENMQLHIHPDMKIPPDWSSLNKLRELRLNGKDKIFDDLSFIHSLPKLKSLFMADHYIYSPYQLISKKQIPILSRPKFATQTGYEDRSNDYKLFALPLERVLSIGAALGKSKLSKTDKERYFRTITKVKRLKNLPVFSADDLLALMNVSHIDLRTILQKQLQEISSREKSIETLGISSQLYVAGTPGRKKAEIKEKMSILKIPLATKFSDQVTHVVVGKNPREYEALQGGHFKIISESDLYERFKSDAPGFIVAAVDTGKLDVENNLLPLLESDQSANIMVGMEMLKNGGVPEELIDTVLVIYKSCPDTKVRGIAKKLLDRNAPKEYLPIIADAQRFTGLAGNAKAQEINKKLEKLARSTSRSAAAKLSLLFHKRYKKGLRYVLYHFHESCPERTAALHALMEGTHLNYRAGLGFKDWRGKDPDTVTFFNMKTPAKFPVDIVGHVPLIETADFHNCKFTSLPVNFGDLKDLKKIDLSFNFLGSIPKSVQNMKQLTHLNLQMNNFKTIPSTLKSMTQLKILDLRFNRLKNEPSRLEISEEIKEGLPDCEILV